MALRDTAVRRALLTNLSPRMLDAAVDSAGLANLFERRLSTDAARTPARAAAPCDSGRRRATAGGGSTARAAHLDEMAPATAELVSELDRFGERGDVRIPASMYRHLAHRPGVLALARTLIAPLDQDGRLGGMIDCAGRLAGTAAGRLAGELTAPPGPATRADGHDALIAFTGGVIGKMVPICALLRRALPA